MDFRKYPKGKSWVDCLEVVISGHTEPITGNSMQKHLSPVTPETYAIRETSWTNTITFEIREVRWVIRSPLYTRDSGFKSRCALSLLKLRSRYETDCIIVISCRVKFSLVLLEMFSHPVQLWCSPIPIRIVNWEHPSSGLGNLNFFYLVICIP